MSDLFANYTIRVSRILYLIIAIILFNSFSVKAQQGDRNATEQIVDVDTVATFDPETRKESVVYVKNDLTVHLNPDFLPVFYPCKSERPENRDKCTTEKLADFIQKNMIYPMELKESKKEGTVNIRFIISDAGIVTQIKVIDSPDQYMFMEAIKVIQFLNTAFEEAPFFPGKLNGEPINYKMILPIKFKYKE